jgi:hypothetical protein
MERSILMNLKLLAATAAGALTLALAGSASALTTYTLDLGNAAISGYPAPYGSVAINLLNSTTATVSFTAANTGGYYYFFTGAQAADVNVNATSWTLSGLTENGAGTLSDGGGNQVDGHGYFNQTTDLTDGFTDRSTAISFTLTNTGGTWASDSVVLIGNNLGHTVGAHIGVCTNAACTGDFAATGFATTGGGGGVPEPATWAMMILGFGGIGALMRRRRTQLASAFI